jgi:SAM-dependent methyltransferase
MPLADASYDVCYCQQGMQHMADPAAALRDMRRALKPGGRLGVATWTTSPFHVFRQVVARIAQGTSRPTDFGHDAGDLERALLDAGFSDVAVQTRQLTSRFEGGVEQAIRIAMGTSTGPIIQGLAADQQQAVRVALLAVLHGMDKDGVVLIPSETNIASARV